MLRKFAALVILTGGLSASVLIPSAAMASTAATPTVNYSSYLVSSATGSNQSVSQSATFTFNNFPTSFHFYH